MILSKYLENYECVSTHSILSEHHNTGLFSSQIVLNDEVKIININDGSLLPQFAFATVSSDDFTLKLSNNLLKLWLRDDTRCIKLDQNITEEWFFQLSTLHDFASLQYSDIEFVKDVFKNLCTGE